MYILGTTGALRADVLTGTIQVRKVKFDAEMEDVSTTASGGHGCGDEVLACELADSMLNGTPPTVGIREGVESSAVCFAIDEAMDSRRIVELAPLWKQVDSV
ncbi:MAG: hypothetical protein E4H02_07625 [Lentisphaerales bacterium]|jgi:hypothetical protein|nr:MAG: hypothetical protein E4H02_07625 [Lentisphaerales bacterium]